MTKKTFALILVAIWLTACATRPEASQLVSQVTTAATDTAAPLPTAEPTSTSEPTATLTLTPTNTSVPPTKTRTPTPAPTPLGGGSGQILMFISMNIVQFRIEDAENFSVVMSVDKLISEFEITEFSTLRTDYIAPNGELAAVWNCASKHCITKRGTLYLFTLDWQHKAALDVAGTPSFLGMSADHTRLLYYLESTMASDFYLVKTDPKGFGEVISLGRMTNVTWASDRQTLYSQKGSKVSQLDMDGDTLKTFECNFNNNCIHAQSPDGKRFAGIQKFVPTGLGNPVITISNQDFSEKKSIFISEDKALILSIEWLPDNQHIVVYGMTAKQRTRRFWRLDYLSVIDVESGKERIIKLDIPEESEWFAPCGLTPDGNHLIYLGAGGRVKEEGHILMSGRFAQMFPVSTVEPEFEQITSFDDTWESCPVWVPHSIQFLDSEIARNPQSGF